ncbi:MAG: hypothetical protein OEO23_13595, partial [Gemmatimonadota bacterium]|nr:hypothetical protein [Gemmatimonadota bacterium]
MTRGGLGLAVVLSLALLPARGEESAPPVAGPRLHEAGAPPGRAGAPGESSCFECHNDLELNEPEGRLEILGLPRSWDAGAAYALTVILESEGMVRAGFQAGASAGALRPLDDGVSVVPDSLGRSYVGHAAGRTIPDSGERTRWIMEW